MARYAFPAKLTFFLGGFLVWAAHFGFIYGFTGLACARAWHESHLLGFGVVPVTLVAATGIALLINATILLTAFAERGPGIQDEADESLRAFWRYGTALIAMLSSVAVLWDGLPSILVRACT